MSLDLSHSRVKIGTLGMQMKRIENDVMRLGLFHYYNSDRQQVHLNPREQGSTNTTYLLPYADLYNYALLDGRRITPTTRATRNTAGSSLIHAMFNDEACAGEVRAVFVHRQPGVACSEQTVLLLAKWMVESPYTPLNQGSFIGNKFPWELIPGSTGSMKIPKHPALDPSLSNCQAFNVKYLAVLLNIPTPGCGLLRQWIV
ncbi:hypothetical protein B0H13DRAFT_1926379 [Mycena leptocephala]|nr:hypothetical protein B0H13DRAFT_1926379 [Mycena leptocephala]